MGCILGASRACTGPGDCAGRQVCSADSRQFEACDCRGVGSGGSGPSNSGSGGTLDAGADVSSGAAPSTGGTSNAGGTPSTGGTFNADANAGSGGTFDDAGAAGSGGTLGAAGQSGAGGLAGEDGGGCLTVPFEVARGQAGPHGIVTDDSYVYWANQGDGTIAKSPLAQAAPTVHQAGLTGPFALASPNVWTELGTSPTAGSAVLALPSGITRVGNQDRPTSIVLLRSGYAWSTLGDGTVHFCAGTDAPCASPATLAQGQHPIEVRGTSAADSSSADTVYWVNRNLGTVVSCPTSGCSGTPKVIAANEDQPHSIAVDEDEVYWATITEIRKCPLTGCTGEPIRVVTGANVYYIAVGNGAVFWTDLQQRAIKKCPTSGCTSHESIACNLSLPTQITVAFNGWVYWTQMDNRVLRYGW